MTGRLSWRALLASRSGELSRDLTNWFLVGAAAAVAFPSRVPPRRGLFGKPLGRVQMTLKLRNGLRLRCRFDELEGYYAAFVEGSYGTNSIDLSTVDLIIDGGANVGAATLWFASKAPKARIISVEPNPGVFLRLVANVRRNGLQARVTPIGTALGARSGVASIFDDGWSVAAVTREGVAPGFAAVPQISLADLVDDCRLGQTNLLKLDCEGAEYDVLLSSPPELLRRFQVIYAECHSVPGHDPSELRVHLERAGFRVEIDSSGGQSGMLSAALQMAGARTTEVDA